MNLTELNAAAADIERDYRATVQGPLEAVVLASDAAVKAAVAARDQSCDNGTDEALKDAMQALAATGQEMVTAVGAARGARTKALRKAGLR